PHRRRDPDERRAAHLQRADRVRHGLPALEVALDLRLGQRTLVDDADGPGSRPGDRLNGHSSAECGVRNAECKWKVGPRVTVNWWRTDVTGHQQRWVSSLWTHSRRNRMKGVLTAALAATALAVAACSEQDSAGRPLGLAAAVD